MLLHLKLVSQRLFVLSPQDGRVKISSLSCGYARLAQDHSHTYEPSPARGAPHTDEFDSLEPEPSPARGAPHTDEFDSLEPEPSQISESDSYVYGHL
jgi:hypothetical protein